MTGHQTGARRILNNTAARSLATRHAEAWYVATVLAAAAASWARRDDTARTVSLGLLYEPTPITPAPSGTILDGGTL